MMDHVGTFEEVLLECMKFRMTNVQETHCIPTDDPVCAAANENGKCFVPLRRLLSLHGELREPMARLVVWTVRIPAALNEKDKFKFLSLNNAAAAGH